MSATPIFGDPTSSAHARLRDRLQLWDSDRADTLAQVALPAVWDIVAGHLWEMAERYRSGEVDGWEVGEWLEAEAGSLEGIAGTWGQP